MLNSRSLFRLWPLAFIAPVAPSMLEQVAPVRAPHSPPVDRGPLTPGTFALTNVNVVSMTRDGVERDVTVLVRDGRIAAVARNVAIPAVARRIDARGRYLLPGLADMHTHLFSDESIPKSAGAAELGVMLANGITSARLMIGTPEHLGLRDQVASGRVLGPKLWVASAQLAGRKFPNAYVISNAEQVRGIVRAVADSGFDFVKLTIGLTPAIYEAAMAAGREAGIPVVGHVETSVGVPRALAAQQQIEHLDSYLEAVLRDDAPMKNALTQGLVFSPANWASMDHIDDVKIAAIAGATARAKIWSSPTLNVFNKAFAAREPDDSLRARPDWAMMPAEFKRTYLTARERYWAPATTAQRTDARRARYIDVRNKLVKAIHDSGGRILAGSDTPEWFHVYGWGLHRELQAYVTAGLTPYQALATATVNPAEYLKQASDWGRVAVGQRADLLLVDENPLIDIRHTERIRGVSFGGRWIDRAELDSMLERGRRAITAVDSVPTGSATPGSAQSAPLTPQQAAQSLLEADRAFAASGMGSDMIDSYTAMFSDSVIMPTPPAGFALGKSAVLGALRALPDAQGSRLSWRPARVGVSADGEHGFSYGYAAQRRADGSTAPLKYLAYWVREQGAWKVRAYRRTRAPGPSSDSALAAPALPARMVAPSRDAAAMASLRRELMQAEQGFSDEAQRIGLGNAFASMGTADAVNMGGPSSNVFVIGADRIAQLVSGGNMTVSPVTWGADTALVASSGDLGITFGVIKAKNPPAGSAPNAGSPFFTIWRRAAKGAPWRYVAE